MRSLVLMAVMLTLPGLLPAATPADDIGPVLQSLIEAERSFARMSVEKGIHDAFLTNLADDGVVFRPDPVPGKRWIAENPPDPGRLSWEPSYGEVSRAGDMGFTTGPYEYRSAGENPRVGTGHFVTVWKKQADGTWKVAIDFGAPHAKPEHPEVLALRPGNGTKAEKRSANAAKERTGLLEADRAFAHAAGKNAAEAYAAHAASDILFLRFRQQPVVGRDDLRKELEQKPGALTWKAIAGDVSGSGDLGYTYGSAQFQPAEPHTLLHTGYYLRVWRREPKSRWQVALDLMVLVPPQPK